MRHKVLIAEDESRMREVIAMLLSDLPLDFVEAGNGQLEDELRLALSHAGIAPPPIHHVRRLGGILPQQHEIVERMKDVHKRLSTAERRIKTIESRFGKSAATVLKEAPRFKGEGKDLAKQFPDRAHALLVDMGDGHHRVSVRAPYNHKDGADELCRQFPSGGGRKAAAGINALSRDSLDRFVESFKLQFGGAK